MEIMEPVSGLKDEITGMYVLITTYSKNSFLSKEELHVVEEMEQIISFNS